MPMNNSRVKINANIKSLCAWCARPIKFGLNITNPWALRNYLILDDFGLSQSEAIMMRDQYKFMLQFSGAGNDGRQREVTQVALRYLKQHDLDSSCIERFKDSRCKGPLSKAYLSAIIHSPPDIIIVFIVYV